MALRQSTKIAIGFALLSGGVYFGYNAVTDAMIMNEKFEPITPGEVNIVGVDAGTGYRIITANYMAHLVEASGEFGNQGSSDGGGATSGSIKKRVPVKELLRTLQGDGKALGQFVMAMNDMSENDKWPTGRVYWRAEDIKKALDGDPALKNKLEKDLNMRLDGTPLPTLNLYALENGIIIDTPVTVTVIKGGKPTQVTGRVLEPYTPRMISVVRQDYAEKSDVTAATQAGYYRTRAEDLLKDPSRREIISETLRGRIDPKVAQQRVEVPERLLKSATVVVNDDMITGARYQEYKGEDGKPYYNLTVTLNEEGRRRLWQYSKKRVGTQVLLTTDGIPVTQARIQHDLAQSELTISQMQDYNLVKESVDRINERAKTRLSSL